MQMHSGETDQTHQIKLPSAIERVQWADLRAAPGGTVGLEVSTRYVGNGAQLQIKLTDHQGTTHGTFKNQIHNNHLSAEIQVSPKARDALYAEVKLPKHGLTQKSPALLLTAPVTIKNAEWSKDEARRGDVITLSADVKGVPDGTEAKIQIMEHDEESAHDPVTELSALVEKKKVEVEWEYEYHEDTDRIPTEEEAAKGYRPPEYFFQVEVEGVEAESGLLTFKDQFFIQLIDAVEQVAYALQEYLISLPDGREETGRLDEKGRLQIDRTLPGPYEVIFPDLYDKEPQGEQVEGSSGEDDVTESDVAPDGKAKAGVQSGSQHRIEHRGQTRELVWGAKVSEAFRRKVVRICRDLEVNPDYLMAAMAFETGRTFSPSVTNPKSSATGLIQFLESTAQDLGTSTEELAKMTAVEQLDYVKKYFTPYKGDLELLSDVYMAILQPSVVGEPASYVMFEKGSDEYADNRGLDVNGDGKITKAEATRKVKEQLEKGKEFRK